MTLDVNVIWIMGNNFCGSTMFGLMLGNHPDTLMVGEAVHLDDINGTRECLVCGTTKQCKLVKNCHNRDIENWYKIVSGLESKNYIIDSSKSYKWFTKLYNNGVHRKYNIYPVTLYKDPVRQISSIIKHSFYRASKKHRTFTEAYKHAKDEFIRTQYELLNLSRKFFAREFVEYKQLVTNPKHEITRVLDHFKFPITSDMEMFWENNYHHSIGGNVGARYMVKGVQPSVFKTQKDFFHQYVEHNKTVFEDNTFKSILMNETIEEILKDEDIIKLCHILSDEYDIDYRNLLIPTLKRY